MNVCYIENNPSNYLTNINHFQFPCCVSQPYVSQKSIWKSTHFSGTLSINKHHCFDHAQEPYAFSNRIGWPKYYYTSCTFEESALFSCACSNHSETAISWSTFCTCRDFDQDAPPKCALVISDARKMLSHNSWFLKVYTMPCTFYHYYVFFINVRKTFVVENRVVANFSLK